MFELLENMLAMLNSHLNAGGATFDSFDSLLTQYSRIREYCKGEAFGFVDMP